MNPPVVGLLTKQQRVVPPHGPAPRPPRALRERETQHPEPNANNGGHSNAMARSSIDTERGTSLVPASDVRRRRDKQAQIPECLGGPRIRFVSPGPVLRRVA